MEGTVVEEKTQFLTKARFAKMVESTVIEKEIPYMEAILDVCDVKGIEPEDVSKFISPVIKNKLQAEAESLNFLPSDINSIALE